MEDLKIDIKINLIKSEPFSIDCDDIIDNMDDDTGIEFDTFMMNLHLVLAQYMFDLNQVNSQIIEPNQLIIYANRYTKTNRDKSVKYCIKLIEELPCNYLRVDKRRKYRGSHLYSIFVNNIELGNFFDAQHEIRKLVKNFMKEETYNEI